MNRRLVIIGGGSAGMAAAIEAFNNGIKDVLIIEKDQCLGGILNQCIHNGFGLIEFKQELTGPEFLQRFVDEINRLGIEYKLNTTVLSIDKNKNLIYANKNEGVVKIQCESIIYTCGCYERSAGAISLPGQRPSGVITAGAAQKYLNIHGYLPGKRIVILGSGDIGLIMARRLTLEGAKVICVAELMPYSNGLNRNIVQCLNDYDIPLYLSTTVTNVIGNERVEKVVLSNVDEKLNPIPGTEKEIECDTLVLSVGLSPYLSVIRPLGLEMSKSKGPAVNQFNETSLSGFFVAGNCLHVHDVVDYVVEEARDAAKGAVLYLKHELSDQNACQINCSNNISYVVPQYINNSVMGDVTLKFRVRKPVENCRVIVKNKDEIIYSMRHLILIPSEMQMIKIKKDKLFNSEEIGPLTLELEVS